MPGTEYREDKRTDQQRGPNRRSVLAGSGSAGDWEPHCHRSDRSHRERFRISKSARSRRLAGAGTAAVLHRRKATAPRNQQERKQLSATAIRTRRPCRVRSYASRPARFWAMANAVGQPEETEYHNCGAGEQAGAYRLGGADNGATLSWHTLQPSARNEYQHES
jgi:hypothetical protein